ncbi:MAG: transporter substrate-binding domain-containing protein [Cyclobacteriaceae bacterium]
MSDLRIILLVLSFFLCLFSKAQLSGDTFNSANKSKQAQLIYVYNNATDFAKENDKGEVSGVLVDLMKEFEEYVAEEYEIDLRVDFVQIEQANFAEFLTAVQSSNGGVFGLSNTSISEERKKFLQFSQPFMSNILVLVTHKNVTELRSMSEISKQFVDMKALSVTSSIYLKSLKKIKDKYYPDMEIVHHKSGLDVIEALAEDEKGFAIVDLLYYFDYFKKGYPIKRHKIGDESGDDFGIIMPPDSDWKAVLDSFFETGFLQSPKYREIVSNHLGKSSLRLIR